MEVLRCLGDSHFWQKLRRIKEEVKEIQGSALQYGNYTEKVKAADVDGSIDGREQKRDFMAFVACTHP